MRNKSPKNFLLAFVSLMSRGRIRIVVGQQGFTINAENALAIIATVIVLAMLL